MADISRYIEKINKAKYGEEVRSSISDALTAMNEEAENAKEWATGEGTDVPGGGSVPGTENNAAYYAEQAAAQAEAAAGSAASGIAALANEALTFDASTAYAAGEYVLQNSVLYRFTVDHAAGEWTGTDATAVKIGGEIGDLKASLSDVASYVELPLTTLNSAYISPSSLKILSSSKRKCVYAPVTDLKMIVVTKMLSARFVFGFTRTVPAYDIQIFDYLARHNETKVVLRVPSDANYVVVYCYDSDYDSATWEEIFNSLAVSYINGAKDYEARAYIDNISDVPSNYIRLDYLESSRAQYVSAGVKFTNATRIIIEAAYPFAPIEEQAEYAIGSRYNTSNRAFTIGRLGSGKLYVGYGATTPVDCYIDENVHLYDLNQNNLYLDGELVYTFDETEFETPNIGVMFATRGNSVSTLYYGSVRIYSCKIYENDVLVRDFVPARRNSDGALTMFDKLNNKAYENLGTEPLIPGNTIGATTNYELIKENKIEIEKIKANVSEIEAEIAEKGYIEEEANRVAEKVRNAQTGNSLTFVACSDLHYAVAVGSSDGVTVAEIQTALQDMRDAIIAIANQTYIDFYACFGDVIYQWQSHGANYNNGVIEMVAVTKLLSDAFSNNPQVRMVGNHDPNCENSNNKEFNANLLNAFEGIYGTMLTKNEEQPYGDYGYHDFERQKIRFIVLNTSFYTPETDLTNGSTYYNVGADQAYWLCTVLDLSAKSDASDWQIVICSHVALDASNYTNVCRYTAVLNAYINGTTWVYSSKSYDFSGKNAAKLALYMNGHTHAYRFKNVQYLNASGIVQNILPMANLYVPNALPGRETESTDGVTYSKTPGTPESTAFQVVTIDFVNKIVYAYHYGAGIDIIMHYDPSTNGSLTTTLDSPVWNTADDAIATVSNGTVTPVSSGYVMIYAKSEIDNTIEVWNYQSMI